MQLKIGLLSISFMFLAALHFIPNSSHQFNTHSDTNLQPTQEASKPLILIWEANIAPDDMVASANFIALDDQGNCYVTSSSGLPIKKFDSNGKFVAAFGSQGTNEGQFESETGIAVDKQGNVYAADFEKRFIQKFDAQGKFLTRWQPEAPVGPTGVGVDSKGNVYVANHRAHDHYIQKFDGSGKLLTQWGTTGTGDGQFTAQSIGGIEALVVDKQDNVYVTDPNNHRIQKFDSDGKFLAQFGTAGTSGNGQFDVPFGLAVDKDGNIYVNDGRFLQKLSAEGEFLAQWSTGSMSVDLDRAAHIAVDDNGDIYVIAYGNITAPTGSFYLPILKKFQQP